MIKKLILATNNNDKVTEIKKILNKTDIEILSMKDAGINYEVTEDKDSLEGNSLKKAEEIYLISGIPCVADDTGLFTIALNGEPGVYSSRYAGENVTYSDNRKKLLDNMKGIPEEKRTAYFRTTVCFYREKTIYYFFEGECKGRILEEERGEKGFGYDAIFLPEGFDKSFAEMTIEEKNTISHRAKAFLKFRDFISDYNKKMR